MLRVLVVVAVRFVREGIFAVLADQPTIAEVTAVADLAAALEVALESDVAVVDVSAPWAADAISALSQVAPQLAIVAIGVNAPSSDVIRLASAGASAYVTAEQGVDELRAVVVGAAAGTAPCCPSVVRSLLDHVAGDGPTARTTAQSAQLTRREVEVLGLLQRGLSNKEIARHLVIGLPTVKNHVHNILRKMGVASRLDAGRTTVGLTATHQ
jgi:DNA-binding NarL/FixJ family response regulator